MAENINYIFSELVGDTHCKFDGEVWSFEEDGATETVVIPVKAISNVQLAKVRSWLWLFLLIIALLAGAIGVYLNGNMILFGIAGFFGVLAIVALIFSVEYVISVVPNSAIDVKIASRRRPVLTGLFDALVKSLHAAQAVETVAQAMESNKDIQ